VTNEVDFVSTHLIFGKNLRQLCRCVGTIAEVADSLEINRVQMNRILNGESFPKPGMLKRICEYFNVDARILLQPLDELETGAFQPHDADISDVWNYTLFGRDYFVPENMLQDILPDGLHTHVSAVFFDRYANLDWDGARFCTKWCAHGAGGGSCRTRHEAVGFDANFCTRIQRRDVANQ